MADSVAASPIAIYLKSLDVTPNPPVLFLPGLTTAPINQGIESEMRQRRNERGLNVLDFELQTAQMPTIAVGFSKWSKELIGLMTGYQIETGSVSDAMFMRTVRMNKATIPGATTGKAGFGMTADQATSEMVAYIDGVQTQLTRQPFATFTPATPTSFAQGANGEIKLSTDLIGKGFATHFFRYSAAAAQVLVDKPFERFQAVVQYVLHDLTVMDVSYDELAVSKAANSTIDVTQTPTVNFLVPNPACLMSIKFHNRRYDCLAS